MAYTSHGHHVEGTDTLKDAPELDMTCKSIISCGDCYREAGIIKTSFDTGRAITMHSRLGYTLPTEIRIKKWNEYLRVKVDPELRSLARAAYSEGSNPPVTRY